MRLAWVVLALWSSFAVAEPWDIPPPPRGQWVVDHTGQVSASAVQTVNQLASELDASGAGQLGVLVTQSTSGVRPRDFATGVFNSWGVGHAGTNDGVLLMVAVSDRKAEIILGDGSKIPTSATDAVMREQVVANMKRGDLSSAVTSAARDLARLARRFGGAAAPPSHADNTGLGPNAYTTPQAPAAPEADPVLAPYAEGSKAFPERSPRSWVVDLTSALTASERAQLDVAASDLYASDKGRVFFLVMRSTRPYPTIEQLQQRFLRQVEPLSRLPLAVIVLDLSGPRSAIVLPPGKVNSAWDMEQHRAAETALWAGSAGAPVQALITAQRFAQQVIEVGIPPRPMRDVLNEGFERNRSTINFGGGGLLIGGLLLLRRWNRRRVRTCETCHQPRQLLDEAADDPHLSSAQKTEERIGSVDYDVWFCQRCSDALVLRYGAWFTGYSTCPECRSKAKTSRTTTLSRATEYSTGSERVDERCEHCSFRNSFTRTTPRIQRSSSSSSSSRSSSSSSRSSFGGGSSSGRGSSGSW